MRTATCKNWQMNGDREETYIDKCPFNVGQQCVLECVEKFKDAVDVPSLVAKETLL